MEHCSIFISYRCMQNILFLELKKQAKNFSDSEITFLMDGFIALLSKMLFETGPHRSQL